MSAPHEMRLRALGGIAEIGAGDDLAAALAQAAERAGIELQGGHLVVCQKVVSKAEGRCVALARIEPSAHAREIAARQAKDPRLIEVILRESRRIVREAPGVLICETHHGFVCANAGVDLSNAPAAEVAVLLPLDPDRSAEDLRTSLMGLGAGPLGVVVSDTFGRPFREGLVDVALGSAGFEALSDLRGERDRAGRELRVTTMACADQLATAAGLLMRKDAGLPAVWIEGYPLVGAGDAKALLRAPERDLFR